jgi:hypothetical protein
MLLLRVRAWRRWMIALGVAWDRSDRGRVEVLDVVHVLHVRLHELAARFDALIRAPPRLDNAREAATNPAGDVTGHELDHMIDRPVFDRLVNAFYGWIQL